MYSEEEDTPRIVEVADNELDFVLDNGNCKGQLSSWAGIKPTAL